MYTLNMWGGNWWESPYAKAKEAEKKRQYPSVCVFCGRKLGPEDIFYLGYDENMIYAETCDSWYCKRWLKWKIKGQKPPK